MIDFNRPLFIGNELQMIRDAVKRKKSIAGNGQYCHKCAERLKTIFQSEEVFMTASGTAALEMSSLVLGLNIGDEVILPSYTFVSTVNAYILRGIRPIFVDIRADTLNINESLIEQAITPKTKAIIVVHYGSVACDMEILQRIARRHKIFLVEDAAHCMGATFKKKPLGSWGDLAILSFHETKNVHCGEGGALLVNRSRLSNKAHVVYEKGTNRRAFLDGLAHKYTWVDLGSSYAMSDLNAAYLYAQLKHLNIILKRRLAIFDYYKIQLQSYENMGLIRLPHIPKHAKHNAHLFYLILKSFKYRKQFIQHCLNHGVQVVFHYVPLHNSPFGIKNSWDQTNLPVTDSVSKKLVRLPLYYGLTDKEVKIIVGVVKKFFDLKAS